MTEAVSMERRIGLFFTVAALSAGCGDKNRAANGAEIIPLPQAPAPTTTASAISSAVPSASASARATPEADPEGVDADAKVRLSALGAGALYSSTEHRFGSTLVERGPLGAAFSFVIEDPTGAAPKEAMRLCDRCDVNDIGESVQLPAALAKRLESYRVIETTPWDGTADQPVEGFDRAVRWKAPDVYASRKGELTKLGTVASTPDVLDSKPTVEAVAYVPAAAMIFVRCGETFSAKDANKPLAYERHFSAFFRAPAR